MNGEEWLTASPYFYPSDSLILDAKGMLIHEVAMDREGKHIPLKYHYHNDILSINLDRTYNRNQDYTVYIKYTSRPNVVEQQGSPAKGFISLMQMVKILISLLRSGQMGSLNFHQYGFQR